LILTNGGRLLQQQALENSQEIEKEGEVASDVGESELSEAN
jgi:hypothetical protein